MILITGGSYQGKKEFARDKFNLLDSDIFVCSPESAQIDLGKRCIAYKTDARCFIDGFDNVMLYGAPEKVLRNEQELRAFFGA